MLNSSVIAGQLTGEIGRFTTDVKPLIAKPDADFTQQQTEYDARIAQVTLVWFGGEWHCHDAALKTDLPHRTYQATAKGQMDANGGSIKLALWDRLTDQYGLSGFGTAQIQSHKDTLQVWETTKKRTAPV